MDENKVEVIEHTKQEKVPFSWKNLWDKFTTGLLVLLLASPILILLYIFMWFINK